MNIFSYHLVKLPFLKTLTSLTFDPIDKHTAGLIHAEYMVAMVLGSPIISTSRFKIREVAIFAQWENEKALDNYLKNKKFGKVLATGWHVRLAFMRQWGSFSSFSVPNEKVELDNINSAVVAVTIAKMKPLEIPRFLHWGRPVEKLVRDHAGTTLSMASYGFPNVISTFSIWNNVDEMTRMVHGHSKMPQPKRHAKAMQEREKKDFHFEFTTLRFKPIAEFGSWKGQKNFVPNLKKPII